MLYPQWTGLLEEYKSDRFGPVLGLSETAGRFIRLRKDTVATKSIEILKNSRSGPCY
jgi:hypothetical protein